MVIVLVIFDSIIIIDNDNVDDAHHDSHRESSHRSYCAMVITVLVSTQDENDD